MEKNRANNITKSKIKNEEYSMLSNYWYLYKGWFRISKRNMLIAILSLAGGILAMYVELYIPKIAVSLVMSQVPVRRLVGVLVIVGILHYLLSQTEEASQQLMNVPLHKYRHVLQEKILNKMCRTVYSNLENPDYKMMLDRSKQLYEHWDRDVMRCIFDSMDFAFLVITIPITCGMLSTLHPAVVLALAAGTWLQYRLGLLSIDWEKKHREFWQRLEMRINYIAGKFIDFSYAKELRLYAADNWLLKKYRRMLRERGKWKKKQLKQGTVVDAFQLIVQMGSQAVVYAFLFTGVMSGRLGADDFVLYLGLALALSNTLSRVAGRVKQMKENMLSISDYRKTMEMPDSWRKRAEAEDTPESESSTADTVFCRNLKNAPEITFSHVSFSYPEAEQETIKDITITIHPGEKIALVGLNGAGKTTLIKLLCGMYEPTKGEILLNGQPASRWELEEWYRLFSVVFQDVGVIPATIAENVACHPVEAAEREQVKKCLEQAGLWKLVESLPHGMDTCLQKEMFREGVNLSGGETQKLLLARAIYREAPILVLDEPTAALDAIAENQLYLQYNELTRGRTSLFISHRLSSTRFCDRILMLENGKIIEEGSHEELLEKQGSYYQLFQVQSYYYQKDRTEGFSSDIDPSWEVSGYVSK